MISKYSPNQTFVSHRDAVVRLVKNQTEQRLDLIEREFVEGFDLIDNYQYTVTVFGSARSREDDLYYKQARKFGGMLADQGFAVVTGGGSGIMEAANRGAFEAGGNSIGLNIKLPYEQVLNDYTTESLAFHHFFARKVMLTYASSALVCFPGGFGTLDELFEVITLIQTEKMPSIPLILVGKSFWASLDKFIRSSLLTKGLISHGEELIYDITDDLNEATRAIVAHRSATSALSKRATSKPKLIPV